MQTERFRIVGMNCGGCVHKVTRTLQAVSGVGDVKISLLDGEATLQYDKQQTSPKQLRAAVLEAGYGVNIDGIKLKATGKGCCSD